MTDGLSWRSAPFWRRGVAGLIDSLLALLAWGLCAMWLVLGLWGLRALPRDARALLTLGVALMALALVFRLVYTVVFVGGCGQTPGRMAMGIAVVSRTGGPPGYGRATLRWLGGLVSGLTLGLVSLPFYLTRRRCGLGDWLGGTRVVLGSPSAERGQG